MSPSMPDQVRQAMHALAAGPDAETPPASTRRRGRTSDLSIDEVLLLHSIDWEPVDLVFGVAWWSIPWGVWQYRTGEIPEATEAFAGAMQEASDHLREECSRVGGSGAVGVRVELRVTAHHIDVSLAATAIRPTSGKGSGIFLSDLSVRDFILLHRAGWQPLGLATGASFVIAPRRSARDWANQQGQNVELTNLTEALYLAREGAMERMQRSGAGMQADGVVAVKLREGPLGRGSRLMQFVAVGTAVGLTDTQHQTIAPSMVVPLDEMTRQFQATSLKTVR
jgi:uncharacterized protein YbjQ (UPF0145 family)